ncbi:MAG: thiamine phosphate synthase [Polyangiaceae bacterium]
MPTRAHRSHVDDFFAPVRLWLVTDPALNDEVVLDTARRLDAAFGSAIGLWFRDKRPAPNVALGKALQLTLQDARFVDSSSALRASAHSWSEVENALRRGAAGIMLSPIFKQKFANPPTGVGFIEDMRAAFPEAYFYALGGVTVHNAPACVHAGASGVAVQGAIWNATAPAAAAEEILRAVQGAAAAVVADSS